MQENPKSSTNPTTSPNTGSNSPSVAREGPNPTPIAPRPEPMGAARATQLQQPHSTMPKAIPLSGPISGSTSGSIPSALSGETGARVGTPTGSHIGTDDSFPRPIDDTTLVPSRAEINATVETQYWRQNHAVRPYTDPKLRYEDYAPAYQYGWESFSKTTHDEPSTFEQAEESLSRGWENAKGSSTLAWGKAKEATRDAWDRVRNAVTHHKHHAHHEDKLHTASERAAERANDHKDDRKDTSTINRM